MTVNTKFSLRDKAYMMFNNEIVVVQVLSIDVGIGDTSICNHTPLVGIKYTVKILSPFKIARTNPTPFIASEKLLYNTREELLAALVVPLDESEIN